MVAGGIAVILGLQLVRPTIGNPPVTAEVQVPEPVRQILRNSCYNCHSNQTRLSWFDQPAPAYWLVAHDVKAARAHLNFSEIGKLPPAVQRGILFEAVNQIRLGAMPLPGYRRAHPESTVTPEELAVLEQYLAPFAAAGTAPGPARLQPAAGDAEYHQWTTTKNGLNQVQPAPNGVAFFPDYKDWKPISTTDRGDNGTLRAILGNEVAVKAIDNKKIQPWPDGAAFAKVAWLAETDEQGNIRPGKFLQVEFMIKDKTKYASTAGWGWARWKTLDLKPYGKDAEFASECVGCHNPVRDNDYVYTMPIERSGQ